MLLTQRRSGSSLLNQVNTVDSEFNFRNERDR
jgi:hypothetical protein